MEWAAQKSPALESPALEGPALEGPALEGPALEGPALETCPSKSNQQMGPSADPDEISFQVGH